MHATGGRDLPPAEAGSQTGRHPWPPAEAGGYGSYTGFADLGGETSFSSAAVAARHQSDLASRGNALSHPWLSSAAANAASTLASTSSLISSSGTRLSHNAPRSEREHAHPHPSSLPFDRADDRFAERVGED